MFFDETHVGNSVTKPDVFSLESLIAWLEMQPAAKEYDFFCQGACMVGQWVKSVDPTGGPSVGYSSAYYQVNGQRHNLSKFVQIANDGKNRFTFGAALTRARAAQAVA